MGSYAADDFKFIGTGDGHAEDECIDIKAPCKDGKETAKCPGLEGKELTKGTNIQMWKCHGEDNQAFEFVNGRIRCTDRSVPGHQGGLQRWLRQGRLRKGVSRRS